MPLKDPYVCRFYGGDSRVLVLIDPALGPTPGITNFGRAHGSYRTIREVIPPRPINESGVYDYPSFKLIYRLEGWSHHEDPHASLPDMRFLLRDVWDPPLGGAILPPDFKRDRPGQWPPGMALYDEGRLVRYFSPEEIYRRYGNGDCFKLDSTDPGSYGCRFDDEKSVWRIKTAWRGAHVAGNIILGQYYSETMVLDARTGKVLEYSSTDWLLRGVAAAVVLMCAACVLWKGRRKGTKREYAAANETNC